jgi:hypothetical protein
MSPNPEQKHRGEISRSPHFKCAEALHVTAKKKNRSLPAAFRDPELIGRAINCLRTAGKILPAALAKRIGIHPNTSAKLCVHLHGNGRLLRDGRGYTWNEIGTVVPGPMSPSFLAFVTDLMEFLDGKIASCGAFNRGLANAYRNGDENSCFTKRQWTDTLEKARKRLRNCLTVQNDDLLRDILREIALDVPDFLGLIYQRSEYAQQQLTEERKMTYAARKPRIGKDDAFHAARQAKMNARQAEAKAAREQADRRKVAVLEELARQIGAAYDPESAILLATRLAGMKSIDEILATRETA